MSSGRGGCGVRGCVCKVGIRQRVYRSESNADVKCVKECLTSSKSKGKSFVERLDSSKVESRRFVKKECGVESGIDDVGC